MRGLFYIKAVGEGLAKGHRYKIFSRAADIAFRRGPRQASSAGAFLAKPSGSGGAVALKTGARELARGPLGNWGPELFRAMKTFCLIK